MKLYHKYQRKITIAGALTSDVQYKKPVFMFKEDKEREPRTINLNTPRSEFAVSRTRSTVYHLIRCNQTEYNMFVTLTYAENFLDLKESRNHFKLYIKDLNYHLKTKLKYIAIPERQKRGAIHYHCLFFNLPYINLDTFKSFWPYGDARLERSKQLRSIASYVSKYITKNTFDFPKGTRILMRSRNLVVPTVLIEGLQSIPDVIDYRKPVEITTGNVKTVTIYDNKTKWSSRRKD